LLPLTLKAILALSKGESRGGLLMSVLAIFRWQGDSESLLATVDKELEHPVARDRPHRRMHVRGRGDDGMVIVDVWDSEEDFRAMMDDPQFQKNLQDAGTPEPDALELFDVHAAIPDSSRTLPKRDGVERDVEENRRLVGRYFDLLNGSDFSAAGEVLSPDVVFLGPRAPEGIRGLDAFGEFIAALRRDSPDLRFAERETVVEGDRTASVFTMTRTHRTADGNAKTIVTEGMDLFRIANGKIHEIRAYFDRLGLLVEMGVLEPPPHA
jgi:ketosteroid isomerase-like protein